MHPARLRAALAALAAIIVMPAALHAQRISTPSGIAPRSYDTTPAHRVVDATVGAADSVRPAWSPRTRGGRIALRALAGVLVAVPGAYLGGAAGRRLLPDHCNGCDDPGLEPTLGGALIGVGTTSALLAGSLRLGDRCTTGARMRWAAAGAALGLGAVAGTLHATRGVGTTLLSFPVAAMLPAFTSTLCEARQRA